MASLLLVDDDESLLEVLAHQLRELGYDVRTAKNGEEALASFRKSPTEILVTDVMLPDTDGITLLGKIKRMAPETIVVVITAYGDVEDAIKACQLGADDYLTKPFSKEQLRFALAKAERLRKLEKENVELRSELSERFKFKNLVARSAAMESVLRMAHKVAQSDVTVLIEGESGTGKEVLARAIHEASPRRRGPFVAVNCPSIPDNLLESELFGHVRGAFTGALRDKPGKFELAKGGTIFLDEIGDLKLDLQAKLLRVLQEREIERIGDTKPRPIDVRIIAATHRDLRQLIREGRFREDLYYRLSVVPLIIPPLRERKEDIPYLVDAFLNKYGGTKKYRVTKEAMRVLLSYDWPGNVRELENVVHRAVVLAGGDVIDVDALPPHLLAGPVGREEKAVSLEAIERAAILAALEKHGWNKTRAAAELQVPRHVLLYRMKKFGIPSTPPRA